MHRSEFGRHDILWNSADLLKKICYIFRLKIAQIEWYAKSVFSEKKLRVHEMTKIRSINAVTKEFLRSARPRLIVRAANDKVPTFTYLISDTAVGWGDIKEECYDEIDDVWAVPMYWREVTRTNQRLCLGTFPVLADYVVEHWGKKGLAYCDPDSGLGVALFELDCTVHIGTHCALSARERL